MMLCVKSSVAHELTLVEHTSDLRAQEMESGRAEVQGLQLQKQFEAILSYMRPYIKNKNEKTNHKQELGLAQWLKCPFCMCATLV